MGATVSNQLGGTRSLNKLIREHRDALTIELLHYGLHLNQLGTSLLNWVDLLAIVKYPRQASPLYQSMTGGEYGDWVTSDYLLAGVLDALNWLVWAKSTDGARGVNKPKRIPRPTDCENTTSTNGGDSDGERVINPSQITIEEAATFF